jgi:hypothetical protein
MSRWTNFGLVVAEFVDGSGSRAGGVGACAVRPLRPNIEQVVARRRDILATWEVATKARWLREESVVGVGRRDGHSALGINAAIGSRNFQRHRHQCDLRLALVAIGGG